MHWLHWEPLTHVIIVIVKRIASSHIVVIVSIVTRRMVR
jgi:hypothetical protein